MHIINPIHGINPVNGIYFRSYSNLEFFQLFKKKVNEKNLTFIFRHIVYLTCLLLLLVFASSNARVTR